MPLNTDIAFTLTGYQGQADDGRATIERFGHSERWRRSGGVLAICWGAAVGAVFVPVAHFLLVPGFLVGGLIAAAGRWRERERVIEAHGTCPDCGTHQTFAVDRGWSFPGSLTCGTCSRALTAKANGKVA